MYDNLIESMERYRDSPKGFGCILAHAMGLGKTMQVVAFTDIFLRHTPAKKVLCIVPINTIQNWVAEFNRWLPSADSLPDGGAFDVRPRSFELYLLNDSQKNLEQRSGVIFQWEQTGGVLLMGYEIFRMMATRAQRKKRDKNGNGSGGGTGSGANKKQNGNKSHNQAQPLCVDLEEEDRDKLILDRIQTVLMDPGPDLVMCDEGHRIKNVAASTSLSLKAISTKRRLVLTGYPLQNNLMEYWCMVDFVRPNYLGNKIEFSNMFERPIQNGQCVDSTPKDVRVMRHRAHVLHEQLKGFVQRRSHTVLRASLPPKVEYVLLVAMTPMQKAAYKRFMDEVIVNKFASSNPLKAFAVCCKIWNHTDVLYNYIKKKDSDEDLEELDLDEKEELEDKTSSSTSKKSSKKSQPNPNTGGGNSKQPHGNLDNNKDADYAWAEGLFEDYASGMIENSNKIAIFLSILEETIKAGDRLLLFSQSLLTLNLLESFLQRTKIPGCSETTWVPNVNYYRLDGSTPSLERERLINAFNGVRFDKETVERGGDISMQPLLFLVSTRAGSLGVNLVGANRVVVFDASWNPCHDSQAVCRVYRYGQERTSYIYRLVTDSSLERRIYDRQINKQGMSNRVVDEMSPDAHMNSKDMHTLLCLEEDEQVGQIDKATGKNIEVDPEGLTPKDEVLSKVLRHCSGSVTTQPFTHESLLIDRREKRLSPAEKRLAERSFEIEKSAKITYKRSSYAAYYPEAQSAQSALNGHNTPLPSMPTNGNSGANKPSASEAIRNSITLPNVGLQLSRNNYSSFYSNNSGSTKTPHHPTYPAAPSSVGGCVQPRRQPDPEQQQQQQQQPRQQPGSKFPMEALAKQGVNIQEVYVPRDLKIPTNSNGHPPIGLKAGQKVMLIQTPKGIYLRLNEQIIKIKLPAALLSQFRAAQPEQPHSQQQQPDQKLPAAAASEGENTGQQQVTLENTIFSPFAQKSASASDGANDRREGL